MSERKWYMGKEPINEIREVVRKVESSLVSGEYTKIGSESGGGRLPASSIEICIAEYGGKVTPAPQSAYDTLAPIMDMESEAPRWLVDFDLWIDGKQSDLTLSLTIEPDEEGKLKVFIDNLHIL